MGFLNYRSSLVLLVFCSISLEIKIPCFLGGIVSKTEVVGAKEGDAEGKRRGRKREGKRKREKRKEDLLHPCVK